MIGKIYKVEIYDRPFTTAQIENRLVRDQRPRPTQLPQRDEEREEREETCLTAFDGNRCTGRIVLTTKTFQEESDNEQDRNTVTKTLGSVEYIGESDHALWRKPMNGGSWERVPRLYNGATAENTIILPHLAQGLHAFSVRDSKGALLTPNSGYELVEIPSDGPLLSIAGNKVEYYGSHWLWMRPSDDKENWFRVRRRSSQYEDRLSGGRGSWQFELRTSDSANKRVAAGELRSSY